MSSLPSHDGPSNGSALFDCSHNETSNYQNYTNVGQHGGVINNLNIGHQTTNYQSTRLSPLGMLAFCSSIHEFTQQQRNSGNVVHLVPLSILLHASILLGVLKLRDFGSFKS